jgi:molybdopterin-guanine dinucleotide biosynthesis protein A
VAAPIADPSEITLAVLAGGEGTRMGRPKAWLELAGEPILRVILRQFAWRGPTLLVTAPGRERPPGAAGFDREVTDPVANVGPLRGVLTALEHCRTSFLVVVTVDMPAVRSEHLLWVAAALNARDGLAGVLLTQRGADGPQVEPFPCAFRPAARDRVAAHLSEGRRAVHSLLSLARFAAVPAPDGWDPRTWQNLNSPADLQSYLDSMRDASSSP